MRELEQCLCGKGDCERHASGLTSAASAHLSALKKQRAVRARRDPQDPKDRGQNDQEFMSLSIQLIEARVLRASCERHLREGHPERRPNKHPTQSERVLAAQEFMQLCHGMVVIFTWSYLERLWQHTEKERPVTSQRLR